MDEPLDILVFAPHPDDGEIGCGGSLVLAAQQGQRVAIVDLSKAEGSTRGDVQRRERETIRASKRLGLVHRFNLELADTELGHDPGHRAQLVRIIRETRPRIVLGPHVQDRHPDHAATGKLVNEAFFFAGVASVGEGLAYRPERLYYYMLHHPFEPSLVVDITKVWDTKMAAIEVYESQFAGLDDNISNSAAPGSADRSTFLRFIEARAIYFGAMIGAAYGEPFHVAGPVALRGFPELEAPSPPTAWPRGYSVYSP